jgi:hypothetical protein
MTMYLEQYYARAGNDMETLIADMSLAPDGGTSDPAAWEDWMECVARAVQGVSE